MSNQVTNEYLEALLRVHNNKPWKDVPSGDENAARTRFYGALGRQAGDFFQYTTHNPAFCGGIARLAGSGMRPSQGLSPLDASLIMGKNMVGTKLIANLFNYRFTKLEFALLGEVPFTESVLKACASTHILLPVVPMSLFDVCCLHRGVMAFADLNWDHNSSRRAGDFVNYPMSLGWSLIKYPSWDSNQPPDSPIPTYSEYVDLLKKKAKFSDPEKVVVSVPVGAAEMFYAMLVRHKLFGEEFCPSDRRIVTCSSLSYDHLLPVTIGQQKSDMLTELFEVGIWFGSIHPKDPLGGNLTLGTKVMHSFEEEDTGT